MLFIRQNATHKVVLGPFVDVGDGFTPETGITLSGADEAEAILHDNGTVVDISGYTWAAITTADGYYHLTLQTGISGTVGHLTIVVQDDSVCLPVKADFTVVEEAIYDSIFASAAGSLATEAKQDTIDTVVDAIKLETDKLTLGDAGAGVAGSIIEEIENRATPAQVQTELGTYDGPTKAEMDSAVGTQADAAAAGDPSSAESVMQYVKQIVNILVGTAGVTTFPAEAAPANAVSLAEVIRAIHTDVTGLNGDAMRGTDNAALASVLGALTDAAAAGDPTTADTIMQYVKQLINILIGTAGIATWPAATAPGNAVSIAEALRAVYDDTNEIGAAGAGLTEAGGTGDHLTAVPWNANWDAEVESEVNDAIDTAIAELGVGAPTATPTLRTGMMLMYMAMRNKLVVQTSGTDALEIYNDAGTKIAAKTITDDGSDYTEAEMA